jgi:hypothetical protein
LGGDLIPVVDNVNTFDTTLSVETYNDLFTDLTDSTSLASTNNHFIGYLSADPLFGKTTATAYLELKPNVFPYLFEFPHKDSVTQFDSVVLVLKYKDSYGDTNSVLNFTVYGIDPNADFRYDTFYLVRSNNIALGPALGSRSGIIPARLSDSVYAFRDTTVNQLRIRLSNSFGLQMLGYDTTNAYKSDSLFRTYLRGFAIVPALTGNAAVGIDPSTSKLAFYYHYKNGAITDTAVVSYFTFTSFCAHANLVQRNYTGSQLLTYQGGTTPDNLVFLQNTPGSFATIKIPGLQTLSNRVVHRAELIMEQVYDPSDLIYATPTYLFLDAYDTAKKTYRTIPYDFTIDGNGNYNSGSFGMNGKSTVDAVNNPIKVWKFNITRYIQNVLTKKEPLHDFRVTAPFVLKDYFRALGSDYLQTFSLNPEVLAGRVRLGGGNHPTQRMRLRIIYTKI